MSNDPSLGTKRLKYDRRYYRYIKVYNALQEAYSEVSNANIYRVHGSVPLSADDVEAIVESIRLLYGVIQKIQPVIDQYECGETMTNEQENKMERSRRDIEWEVWHMRAVLTELTNITTAADMLRSRFWMRPDGISQRSVDTLSQISARACEWQEVAHRLQQAVRNEIAVLYSESGGMAQ